jgi:hypothetical protein
MCFHPRNQSGRLDLWRPHKCVLNSDPPSISTRKNKKNKKKNLGRFLDCERGGDRLSAVHLHFGVPSWAVTISPAHGRRHRGNEKNLVRRRRRRRRERSTWRHIVWECLCIHKPLGEFWCATFVFFFFFFSEEWREMGLYTCAADDDDARSTWGIDGRKGSFLSLCGKCDTFSVIRRQSSEFRPVQSTKRY